MRDARRVVDVDVGLEPQGRGQAREERDLQVAVGIVGLERAGALEPRRRRVERLRDDAEDLGSHPRLDQVAQPDGHVGEHAIATHAIQRVDVVEDG